MTTKREVRALLGRVERALYTMLEAAQRPTPWPQRCNACGGIHEHVATCPVLDQLTEPFFKLMDDLDARAGDPRGSWRKRCVVPGGYSQEQRWRYVVRPIYSPQQLPDLS